MGSAHDWPPHITRVPHKPKVAQFCAATWPNFTPALTVVQDVTTTRPEAALRPAPAETIEIALTNGRRMTIPVSLAPPHLAALLAVLDPR